MLQTCYKIGDDEKDIFYNIYYELIISAIIIYMLKNQYLVFIIL